MTFVYEGKHGFVTDTGAEQTFTVAGYDVKVPRYGVWKNTGRKSEVVFTTNDLDAAKEEADRR